MQYQSRLTCNIRQFAIRFWPREDIKFTPQVAPWKGDGAWMVTDVPGP